MQQHAKAFGTTHLRDLFAKDAQRFERFSLQHDGILLDFSKQRINAEILAALHALWHAAEVPALAARMRAGELINHTEGRAVMHTALSQSGNAPVNVGGKNLIPDVHRVLQQMEEFCADIHGGAWRGATGEPIRQIVNIGIGGSDLGPKMAARALAAQHNKNIRGDFVSNEIGIAHV